MRAFLLERETSMKRDDAMRQDEHNTVSAQCASIRDVLLSLIRSADDPLWAVLDAFEAAEALFEQRVGYDATAAYIARKQQRDAISGGASTEAETRVARKDTAINVPVGDADAADTTVDPLVPPGTSEYRLLEQTRATPAGLSRGDLARALSLSGTRITQLINQLEAKGLVSRRDSPAGMLIVPVVAALNGATRWR